MTQLDEHANSWAVGVIEVLQREFPAAMAHVSAGPEDCQVRPRDLHPSFWGCFDWHSAVHMLYSAQRLSALKLRAPVSEQLHSLLQERLNKNALATEYDYLRRNPGYEMPYGRAWLLQLAALTKREELRPLATLSAEHILAWLPKLNHPVRHGVHSNTAFNLYLMLTAARELGMPTLADALSSTARRLFLADAKYPIAWELSGNDFLSNGLCQALVMREALDEAEFARWFNRFLPDHVEAVEVLSALPEVLDPTDGKLAHLYGLSLTRAWMLRALQAHFCPDAATIIERVTPEMVNGVLGQLVDGDFMSTHWLITYAILAVDGG